MSLEQFWKLLLTFGGDSLLCLWSNARRLSRYTTSGAWEPRDFVSQLIQYQWVRRNILQPLRTRKTNHIIVFLRPWIVRSSLQVRYNIIAECLRWQFGSLYSSLRSFFCKDVASRSATHTILSLTHTILSPSFFQKKCRLRQAYHIYTQIQVYISHIYIYIFISYHIIYIYICQTLEGCQDIQHLVLGNPEVLCLNSSNISG